MMHTRPGFAEILQATYTDGKLNSNFYEGGREGGAGVVRRRATKDDTIGSRFVTEN